MDMKRKDALKRLESPLVPTLEHLEKLDAEMSDFAYNHWRWEVANWIQQMEEVLPHVGKRTAEHWGQRLDELKRRMEERDER
jgi:hypothetical protein